MKRFLPSLEKFKFTALALLFLGTLWAAWSLAPDRPSHKPLHDLGDQVAQAFNRK